MPSLIHHKLDPACRLARLMLAEYGVTADPLVETKPWLRDEVLTGIDPAATVPVLVNGSDPPAIGALAVIHAIEERHAPAAVEGLVPANPAERSEMWRLVEWVLGKFNDEVTRYVIEEKIAKRDLRASLDVGALRAAKANLTEHMRYFTYLLATRSWLAGSVMSLADFALAAHLSTLDYLGDVTWDGADEVRDWYARLKSRPAFRGLLADRLAGTPPHEGYADLDF